MRHPESGELELLRQVMLPKRPECSEPSGAFWQAAYRSRDIAKQRELALALSLPSPRSLCRLLALELEPLGSQRKRIFVAGIHRRNVFCWLVRVLHGVKICTFGLAGRRPTRRSLRRLPDRRRSLRRLFQHSNPPPMESPADSRRRGTRQRRSLRQTATDLLRAYAPHRGTTR